MITPIRLRRRSVTLRSGLPCPIVRRRDERDHGEYRTKRVILELYDALADAMTTGRPYQTRLNPAPADPRAAHASRGGPVDPTDAVADSRYSAPETRVG
jgi:hypothetical protein